jgi:hypothetical protein
MEIKGPFKPGEPVDRGPGYEQRDANIKGLIQFAFGMAVVLVVVLFGMRWTFDYFKKIEPLGPTASPMVSATQRELPPNPRLQANPRDDLQVYCAAQEQAVNTYGWVDQQSGIARIPIDRAMDLILQRGLLSRSSSEVAAAGETSLASVVPPAPGGGDVRGQCGYLTEPPANKPLAENEGQAK